MLVKNYISFGEFKEQFKRLNRLNRYSRDWLKAIYEYLQDLEFEVDLDVIAICCQFGEYEDLTELLGDRFDSLKELENAGAFFIELESGGFILDEYSI